ncbi:hypothetical protein Tco_0791116 [Tanacetum coccineum]
MVSGHIYAVGSQEYQVVCTRPDITSSGVDMLDGFDRGLQTNVQVFVDFDYAMGRSITVMSRSITGYGLMILGCVGSLKANLQHKEALSTTEAGYMTFTEAWKKEIWLKGLLIELRYELRLVAGIATGALIKGKKGGFSRPEHKEALSTTEAGYMTFTEAWKKEIWLKGLLIELRYELRLVAGIATGALEKGGSRSEVPSRCVSVLTNSDTKVYPKVFLIDEEDNINLHVVLNVHQFISLVDELMNNTN